MKIKLYNPKDFYTEKDLTSFLKALYGSNCNFEFFLDEYKRAYNFCCDSKHITFLPLSFFQDEEMVAHVALILDDRLPRHQAFFGFFETVNNAMVFEVVWRELIILATIHDIQILKGPVNGSVWHQYRCIKEGSSVPFFRTEPMTPLYYYDFLSQVNPTSEITYSSGIRESYADILKLLKQHKNIIEQKLGEDNFKIEVTEEISQGALLAIAKLSTVAFDEKSWGYTKLDNAEFSKLYDSRKVNEHIYKLFLLYHHNVLVGYCSTMIEGRDLVCKTICITPELQGKGLGNALALRIHEEAERDGIEKIMYVLIKDGNQVHNYPTEDVEIFRRYAVFEYIVTT
ncbi:MAG: GNAT family N-acetyltransferase [bacterium]|nr:GNAT family N-acetyltransferase [bacterium]